MDHKTSRPPAARRAQAAAEATRTTGPGAEANNASAARVKRKAKGITKVTKRLTALS